MKTIIEPFRIKSVEPLHHTTPEQRQAFIEEAGYNLFRIEAGEILIRRRPISCPGAGGRVWRRAGVQSHIDYVVEAIVEVNERKDRIRGLKIVNEPPFLRHFSARLEPAG